MEYQLRCTVSISSSTAHTFGYPISISASADGVEKISGYTMKNASPNRWSPIVYTSNWFAVENKTSGTTALSVTVYSWGGSTRTETYNFDLAVDGSASRLSLSDTTLTMDGSNSCTATITRDSTAFTHTLRVQVGSVYTDYTGLTTSKTFTLPVSWNSQVPNSTYTTGVATLYTYASGSLVGQVSTNFTAYVPSTIVPSFSSITASMINNNVPAAWGIYVQNQSGTTLSINSPTGSYGSTISSYSISGTGIAINARTGTISKLSHSGTITITGKITDSRGRTATKTTSITVHAWSGVYVNASTSAYRCNSEGVVSNEGTSILAKCIAGYSSVNGKNSMTITAQYKRDNESAWLGSIAITNNTDTVLWEGLLDVLYGYDVQFVAADQFSSAVVARSVPGVSRLMNWNSALNAVAVGGVAEIANTFDVKLPIKLSGGLVGSVEDLGAVPLSSTKWGSYLNFDSGGSGIGIAYTNRMSTLNATAIDNGAAAMCFHRPGVYAINFGLDTNNRLSVGGWSMGAVSRAIYHEGYKTSLVYGQNDYATTNVASANSITRSGFYDCSTGTNCAFTGWNWLIHSQHTNGGSYSLQIAGMSGANRYAMRTNKGSWGELYHTLKKPTATDVGLGRVRNVPQIENANTVNYIGSGGTYLIIGTAAGEYGVSWWASDKKFKKDIKKIVSLEALKIINEIEHVEYDLLENEEHVSIGYVANDLQKIYPQSVFEVGGALNIDHRIVLPLATKAIQELSYEIKTLKKEISLLKGENK